MEIQRKKNREQKNEKAKITESKRRKDNREDFRKLINGLKLKALR